MVKRVNNGRRFTESKVTKGIDMALLVQAFEKGLIDYDLARKLETVNKDSNLGNSIIKNICYTIMNSDIKIIARGDITYDLNEVINLSDNLKNHFDAVNDLLKDLVDSDKSATKWIDSTVRLLNKEIDKVSNIISKLKSYESKYE